MRRKRLKPGVTGRAALPPADWVELKKQAWARDGGRCIVPACGKPAEDAHHVEKRSQGGGDVLENIVSLCRRHHDETDAAEDRLVIEPNGSGGFIVARARRVANIGLDGHGTMCTCVFHRVRTLTTRKDSV